ncbi:hypothetical protein EBZ80_02430 [bacterium]|nr:hypothetical protein [bacterium]
MELRIDRENWLWIFEETGGWAEAMRYVRERYRPVPRLPAHWASPQIDIHRGTYDGEARCARLVYSMAPLTIPKAEWDELFEEDHARTAARISERYGIQVLNVRYDMEADVARLVVAPSNDDLPFSLYPYRIESESKTSYY